MSQLNKRNTAKTTNSYEGNRQYEKGAEQQLFELVSMSFLGKDTFYESGNTQINRLDQLVSELVAQNKMTFLSNLSVYARTEMYMRAMPIVMVVLTAKALREQNKTFDGMRAMVANVINRADELTDLYSCALTVFGNKKAIPSAIKKGVADAFNKFDAYQFGKYNRSNALKLADLIRIVHPKAKNAEQGAIFDAIMCDTDPNRTVEPLPVPYTWETELSRAGQEGLSKKDVWEKLVDSNKLGYMATLRNLRNLIDNKVSNLPKALKYLSNPEAVAKSKQMPFRFLSALEANHGNVKVKQALGRAIEASLGNIPQLGENVWIVVDCSLSMKGNWGGNNGGVIPMKTAALFAAAMLKANRDSKNICLTMFSDYAKDINLNPDDLVLTNTDKILKSAFGGGTRLDLAFDHVKKIGFKPDVILLFSDMQAARFGSETNKTFPDALRIAFNLNAYGSTPASDMNGWLQMGGFSDKVFGYINCVRNGTSIVKMLSTEG